MSNSSTYINSIYEAMKVFSKDAVNNSGSPLTIEAVIESIVDAGEGIYSVRYLTNTFEASANPALNYRVGDNVYILVPGGDFSNEKFILGNIKSSAYTPLITENNDRYYDISENLIDNTILKDSEHSLSSYKDTISEPADIYTDTANKFGRLMTGYIESYNFFKLDVLVKTSLVKEQQMYGNYGVVLAIPIVSEDENAYEYFSIDITNMKGSPYQFLEWSPQSLIFSIQNPYDTTRKPVISFFCENFPIQDEEKALDPAYQDLKFKDISFKCVNKLNEQDLNGYFLNISASEGEYFVGTYRNEKTLTPNLRLNGKVTTIPADTLFYWFKEDASIKSTSEDYSRYGGFGWKCLNNKIDVLMEDGVVTYNFDTSVKTFSVKKEDVSFATRYKCVLVFGETIINAIITLRNIESDKFITISCDSLSNTYPSDSDGNVQLIVNAYAKDITNKESFRDQVLYSFLRYDYDNTPINPDEDNFICLSKNKMIKLDIDKDGEEEDVFQSIFTFPVSRINTFTKIYCISKYNKGEEQIDIGTANIGIKTSDNLKYSIIVNNANKIYKYDADGDSPMIEAYDGPAASKVTSIEPLSFDLYDENGNEFSESAYASCHYSWIVPKKCLVTVTNQPEESIREDENNYYYEGTGHLTNLTYTIARRYNKSYAMNGIKLVVNFSDYRIQADVPLFFLKDGESGSNGTSYAVILTSGLNKSESYPYGVRNDGNITQKITFVYSKADEKHWFYRSPQDGVLKRLENQQPLIFTRAYFNGEILDENTYTTEYTVFDENITNPCIFIGDIKANGGVPILPIADTELDLFSNTCNIVQAKVTIKNVSGMNTDEQILYAYYPIEIVIVDSVIPIDGDDKSLVNQPFPSIDGGFYDVLYASDGTNPAYDETEPFYLDNVDSEYYSVSWTAQHHLSQRDVVDDDNQVLTDRIQITPDNKYTDGNTMNYVRADLIMNGNSNVQEMTEKLEAEKNKLIETQEKIAANDDYRDKINLFALGDDNREGWTDIVNKMSTIEELINQRYSLLSPLNKILIDIDNSVVTDTALKDELAELKRTINISLSSELFDTLDRLSEDEYSDEDYIVALDINNSIDQYNLSLPIYNDYILSEQGIIENDIFKSIPAQIYSLNSICFYYNNIEFYNSIYFMMGSYYKNSSYSDFNNFFEKIYNDCLISIYDKNANGVLSINTSEDIRLTTEKDILIEEKDNVEKNIANISAAIGFDHLEIAYIRPIVITTNRYEMANFNAWDGNKIYVDDNKSYIMSPQLGAGTKERDNSFTGIVMGGKTTNNKIRYGLFGYNHGEQTLMLSAENGSAIFGKAKGSGQIVIDPSSTAALLYSSNFFNSTAINNDTGLPISAAYNEVKNIINSRTDIRQTYVNKEGGMLIDLSTPGIVFGTGNFKVTPEGFLVAKAGGSIGGWEIGIDELYSQNFSEGTAGVKLSATGHIAFGSNSGFMYSGNHTTLTSTKDGFYISGDGLSIGSKFKVTKDGVVNIGRGAVSGVGKHWTISATETDTYIKYGERGSTSGIGSVYISTSEICLGNKFKVTSEGVLRLGDGAVKENNSRHWVINSRRRTGASASEGLESYIAYNRTTFGKDERGYINRESVYIGTDGIALGRTFSVDAEGNLKAENADIRGHITGDTGLIGGWTIGPFSDNSPAIYRKLTEGDKLLGTMVLKYDQIYGFNNEHGNDYQCWQLNANGKAFFTDITLWSNDNNMHPTITLENEPEIRSGGLVFKNGAYISGASLNNCTLNNFTLSGYSLISVVDKAGNTHRLLGID